ncbi:MAG: hypothetical protein K0S12_1382 [Bacteroidetes bacterium]|nr:hypothetical protein [Bacteroidota bacterium]
MKTLFRIPKDILAVILVSLFLLLYCALLRFDSTFRIALIMFLVSPFLLIWMVVTVLKSGRTKTKTIWEFFNPESSTLSKQPASQIQIRQLQLSAGYCKFYNLC